MIDTNAILALGLQLAIIFTTYFLFRKWGKVHSFYLGTIVTFVVLLIKDALPWISIWQIEFLYTPKWHHSRIGVICLCLAIVYKGIIHLFSAKWGFINRVQNVLEEKTMKIGPFRVQVFYVCLAIAFLAVETQLHEIVYFNTFMFPDRGFPLDIKLRLG